MEEKLRLIFELEVNDVNNVKEVELIMKECLDALKVKGIEVGVLSAYTKKIK
jgi:hypothetical protein